MGTGEDRAGNRMVAAGVAHNLAPHLVLLGVKRNRDVSGTEEVSGWALEESERLVANEQLDTGNVKGGVVLGVTVFAWTQKEEISEPGQVHCRQIKR